MTTIKKRNLYAVSLKNNTIITFRTVKCKISEAKLSRHIFSYGVTASFTADSNKEKAPFPGLEI